MHDDATLAEQVAQQLRRSILRGDLLPGEAVKERDTAAAMGVSRTPMREAIRILSKEGLLVLRPSRSPIVAELDFKSVSDQAEVLIALEKLSAELACKNATEEDLAHLQEIVDYMAAHFYESDPLDMFEIDMSFHTSIARASHNQALEETHRAYLQRLWHARYLAARQRRNRERVVTQHTAILAAMRARNVQAARDAIDAHLWQLAEDIRQQITMQSAQMGEEPTLSQKVGE
ncbi:GntR family transcriptional regulator [Rhodobacterales bacterium HKCCA1288]|nr:GntR family transcriptional regulator [Rhodobacterales bacterium HKCCA1288]